MWVFGNLLKRGTQKNEQVWGKIISLGRVGKVVVVLMVVEASG